MALSRKEACVYWLFWLSGHMCGLFPYDWRQAYRDYVAKKDSNV